MTHSKVNGLDQISGRFPCLKVIHGPLCSHEVRSAGSLHQSSVGVNTEDRGVAGGVDDKVRFVAGLGGQVEACVHVCTHREQTPVGSFKVKVFGAHEVDVAGQQIHRGRGLEAQRGFEDVVLRSALSLCVRGGIR